jgi:hypothetical protein
MDASDWNALLAGMAAIALGLFAIAGFFWNVRRGVAGYAAEIRAHSKRIGNHYADDERGIWMLAVSKLVGILHSESSW